MNEQAIHGLFRNLKVLGSVKPYQKILTHDGKVRIDESRIMPGLYRTCVQWLYRTVYGEDRNLNLQTIQQIYTQIFSLIDIAIERYMWGHRNNNGKHEQKEKENRVPKRAPFEHMSMIKTEQFIVRAVNAVKESMVGLHNTRVTYADDTNVCSDIDTAIDDIRDRMKRLEMILKPSKLNIDFKIDTDIELQIEM